MSTGYKISEPEGLYYLTLQIVGWVDIFSRKIYKNIVIDSLKFRLTGFKRSQETTLIGVSEQQQIR